MSSPTNVQHLCWPGSERIRCWLGFGAVSALPGLRVGFDLIQTDHASLTRLFGTPFSTKGDGPIWVCLFSGTPTHCDFLLAFKQRPTPPPPTPCPRTRFNSEFEARMAALPCTTGKPRRPTAPRSGSMCRSKFRSQKGTLRRTVPHPWYLGLLVVNTIISIAKRVSFLGVMLKGKISGALFLVQKDRKTRTMLNTIARI